MSATEHLEVNSVHLNDRDKYWIPDLAPLHSSASRRGERVSMPYRKSGIIYPHRDTFTQVVFVLLVVGATWPAYDANEVDIRTNVVGTHDETGSVLPVTANWHRNSGAVWPAEVMVEGIYDGELVDEDPVTMRFNLPLLVNGWFAAP